MTLSCPGRVALPSELIVRNDAKGFGQSYVEAECWEDYGECSAVPALDFIFSDSAWTLTGKQALPVLLSLGREGLRPPCSGRRSFVTGE